MRISSRRGAVLPPDLLAPRPLSPGPRFRIAIVASRFNGAITEGLLEGALRALRGAGIPDRAVTLAWAPGSFELPLVAKRLAASGRFGAVVCLGCVLKGETDHYRYVASEAARGILLAGLETGVPVTFGVLTCATAAQARARSGPGRKNKGREAALAALELAGLWEKMPGENDECRKTRK